MSRYAKANQTIDDLKAVIRKTAIRGSDDGRFTTYCDDEEHPLWDLFKGSASATIYKDLSKIEVDIENVDYIGEYEMPGTEDLEQFEIVGTGANAFPVAWCACGGDWENPLVFVLYIGQKVSFVLTFQKMAMSTTRRRRPRMGTMMMIHHGMMIRTILFSSLIQTS